MAAGREGRFFIGVDVGTGSVRAGLYTLEGRLVSRSTSDIKTWTNPEFPGVSKEQSTTDIWSAVQRAVKDVCWGVDPRLVRGLGFDATCSLAVVDAEGGPVTVSPTEDVERNVILWQDHRAQDEADLINAIAHPVLRFVGGKISPEMQPPKLLWLKKNLFDKCWRRAEYFFDLADYLTFRATGATTRSLCCVVCKWTYIGHQPRKEDDGLTHGWNKSFWKEIGLEDLMDDNFKRIGSEVLCPGEPVGKGLTEKAAEDLGLCLGTPVATGIIDAHAGGLGVLGADASAVVDGAVGVDCKLALIGGTSSCHMATSSSPLFVPGVWGPYYSAMIPGTFLNEGGQSCAGELLDYVLKGRSDLYWQLHQRAVVSEISEYEEAERILQKLAGARMLPDVAMLTKELHILPDFCGNRSPLADPLMRGLVCGLTLSNTLEDMVLRYLAGVQALAYGTRHIIEAMEQNGHKIVVILICGGLRQNGLYIQQHADITGLPVLLTEEKDPVILGSAILAATAAEDDVGLSEAMSRMTRVSLEAAVKPTTLGSVTEYHNKKYQVFKELSRDQKKYRTIMS